MFRKLLLAGGFVLLTSSAMAGNPYTGIGNANYTASLTDMRIVPMVALSTTRTLTLPSAAGTVVGSGASVVGGGPNSGIAEDRLEIIDMFGNVGGSNSCLTITAQTGDTLNGVSGGTFNFCNTFGRVVLRPMGGIGWQIDSNEVTSATVLSGSAVSITSGTPINITSVSLTPGEWDCRGTLGRVITASTSFTIAAGSISTTTAQAPNVASIAAGASVVYSAAANVPGQAIGPVSQIGPVRFSLAATTTVYMVAGDTFSASTDAGYGTLTCRRAL